MIYNPKAIDYSKGVILQSDGTLKANKIGCNVWTLYECDAILCFRKLFGDLHPDVVKKETDQFKEKIRKVKNEYC